MSTEARADRSGLARTFAPDEHRDQLQLKPLESSDWGRSAAPSPPQAPSAELMVATLLAGVQIGDATKWVRLFFEWRLHSNPRNPPEGDDSDLPEAKPFNGN
jgi:hypothetical protein